MLNTDIKIQPGEDIIDTQDGLLFNPYNSLNKEITLNEVQSILSRYGLPGKVNNLKLYQRAFVHKSYTKRPELENETQGITIAPCPGNSMSLKTKSNERLEFLGDGVLECITEKKIALVKNEAIGKLAMEMRLQNWVILSKHAEEKKTRTNLKKLGCLFEAFLGAIFLDFNKITIHDEDKWFDNFFSTGPGFQMAQIFIENIFEQHVNWTDLINNDDNYKNILQVKIQKEFKITPDYLELDHDIELGYKMGVYICIGQSIHSTNASESIPWSQFKTFESVHSYLENNPKILIFLSEAQHKIKKKAEQEACDIAIRLIK